MVTSTTTTTATSSVATTTPEVDNTTDSQLNTTVADLSTPTPTTTPTRSASTQSSSTDITGTDKTGSEPSNIGAVVGGAIGGVAAVVIIVVLVIFFLRSRRRRSKKNRKDSPWVPGVTDLENIERKRTGNGTPLNQPHYDNLDIHGNPNERTDPALDEEGYLKKTKKHGKKQKNKGKSLPRHPAPPAPKQAGQNDGMEEYENVDAKVQAKNDSEKKSKSKLNPAKDTPKKEPGYVNSGHHLLPASAQSEQEYVNIDSKSMRQAGNYANVNGTGNSQVPEESSEEVYENP